MKPVLLINPPEVKFEITKDPMPPLGLAILAGILEKEYHRLCAIRKGPGPDRYFLQV